MTTTEKNVNAGNCPSPWHSGYANDRYPHTCPVCGEKGPRDLPDTIELLQKHRWTIINALRLAAERYDEHMRTMHQCSEPRLAKHFERQAGDCRVLLAALENA